MCQFSGKVKVNQKYNYTLDLEIFDTGDDLGRIIGKNGMTLKSIQTLIKYYIIRQFNLSIKLNLDAGGYRGRQQYHIKQRALGAAQEVIKHGGESVLEPMNASERRFVHTLFEKDNRMSTFSTGEGNERRVVLIRKDAQD